MFFVPFRFFQKIIGQKTIGALPAAWLPCLFVAWGIVTWPDTGLYAAGDAQEDETDAGAFDAENDGEVDFDAEALLDRQRESLNRPFSISPSEDPPGPPEEAGEIEYSPPRNGQGDTAVGSHPVPDLPAARQGETDPDGAPSESVASSPAPAETSSNPVDAPPTQPVAAALGVDGYPVVEIPTPDVGMAPPASILLDPPGVAPPGVVAPVPGTVAPMPLSSGEMPPAQPEQAPPVEKAVVYSVPIVFNEHVEDYINLFQTRLRERFEIWLARSGQYVPMMQKIFKNEDLPEDLVFLALIESGFNPKAYSPADASGPWQFIKKTAQHYGLRVNKWIDERRDPVKSTIAAADYLKNLYGMFQSWTLSMASYNAGEGRIMRAMAASKAEDFWELKQSDHIKDETKNYVPKFMAATIIAKNPEKYGFFIDYHAPFLYDEVEIKRQTSLKSIAKATGISLEQIKIYNPELKLGTTPPNYPGYHIKLPPGKKEIFLAKFHPEKVVKKKAVKASKARKVKKPSPKNKRAPKRRIPSKNLAGLERSATRPGS